MLNSEGWRETKRIMYAPCTHSSGIFRTFTVAFCPNAENSSIFLINARALGLFQGDSLCQELEINREFRDFLGGCPQLHHTWCLCDSSAVFEKYFGK